jgi:hypothetical protein
MTRLEFLRSLADTVAEARYWIEVCYEEDCEAFREHAAALLRQTLKEFRLLPLPSSPSPQDLAAALTTELAVSNAIARSLTALKVGDIHGADEALQVAIERLQAEIAKEVGRHGGQEVVAVSEADASTRGASDQ